MPEIRWEFYPLVAQHEPARTWLTMQRNLQLAPATIDAYVRNLNDYLAFCSKHNLLPETMTRESLALYVQDLGTRANPRGAHILSIGSGCGLSRATMQQRLTVIRLYHDYLIEKQIRPDNPVGRGELRYRERGEYESSGPSPRAAQAPQFTTHTPRHLRLMHLARVHVDLHQIATYAGHKSLQTTMLYLHVSGVELTEAVNRSLADFEQWMARILEGSLT